MHIPFCKSKCDYCDFFSVPKGSVDSSYIAAVCREINCVSRAHKGDSAWSTVYVGGGTPSLMTGEDIHRLFAGIQGAVYGKRSGEVTFEVNPGDVTIPLLETLSACGVTRISCGFQSFTQDALCAVHRSSTERDEWRALEAISSSWQGLLSADFIAGLPYDSPLGLQKGIRTLSECGASHISLYTLTIEENTPLGRRVGKDNEAFYDANRADEMYIAGRDTLLSLGYEQYEVSSFCKEGARCAHNEAYWKYLSYAGCGAGAVSSYYGDTGVRYTNTRDIDEYVSYWLTHEDDARAPRTAEVLDRKTQQEEYFMLGLRTAYGVCEEDYMRRFGRSMAHKTLEHFAQWEKRALAVRRVDDEGTHHAMTGAGLLLLNRFLIDMD